MMQTLFILGRQPALGRAELESLYGAETLQPVGNTAMLCSLPPEKINFARLGGSIKFCTIVGTVDNTDWRQIQKAIVVVGIGLGSQITEGKIQLGISAYDLRISIGQLNAGGLELKKTLRKNGHSVRLVPNQAAALNSAQVLHNHLTGERGIELVLVRDGKQTVVAQTLAEQDIGAYTERDRGRPKRDAFVGMLPPKLAQTIINLAVGPTPPSPKLLVLDPFCGTGVVLQETLLMGFGAYGSDIERRMVDYSQMNLDWATAQVAHDSVAGAAKLPEFKLETGDATDYLWKSVPDFVASETYLGQPFNAAPSAEKLAKVRVACDIIIEKFLKNIGGRLKSGTRLCIAVPAWQNKPGYFTRLPLLDHLSDLGYNRIDFRYTQSSELIYYRPDQIVARELLVITRK